MSAVVRVPCRGNERDFTDFLILTRTLHGALHQISDCVRTFSLIVSESSVQHEYGSVCKRREERGNLSDLGRCTTKRDRRPTKREHSGRRGSVLDNVVTHAGERCHASRHGGVQRLWSQYRIQYSQGAPLRNCRIKKLVYAKDLAVRP